VRINGVGYVEGSIQEITLSRLIPLDVQDNNQVDITWKTLHGIKDA
jgi:hypothetical protein